MTTQPTPDTTDVRDADRQRTRSAVAKYSLAGVALLGIGAALTSAAWTDDAWFSADANAVDPATAIDLRGAYVGTDGTPTDADFTTADEDPRGTSASDFVEIPAEVFANLTAGDSVTVPVWIKNAGTSDLVITAATPVVDGALFAADGATASLEAPPASLAAGAAEPVDLTIALPETADPDAFGGTSGSVVVQFQGAIATRS